MTAESAAVNAFYNHAATAAAVLLLMLGWAGAITADTTKDPKDASLT
jgi:hypothetical protein